jgi:hypothetical protein
MDFLGKMKDGISKGIDTIGAKGKEFVEETQAQPQPAACGTAEKGAEELGELAWHGCSGRGADGRGAGRCARRSRA